MNASKPFSKEPVENVYSGDAEKGIEAPKGMYRVVVENYGYHGEGTEPREVDFKVQVRMNGDQVTNHAGRVSRAKERVEGESLLLPPSSSPPPRPDPSPSPGPGPGPSLNPDPDADPDPVVTFEYTGRQAGGGSDALTAQLQEVARRRAADKARLESVPPNLLQQATALLSATPLKETLTTEALLAIEPSKYKTWGKHYLVTLPQMLRAERRSNFRDLALQHFGRDGMGREAFFETLSSEGELCFAQLEPPKPSGLERLKAQAAAAARAPPCAIQTMPDEFMRGGGCFAPEATLSCIDEDGSSRAIPIASLTAGTRVRTASGGTATVRCVVESACEEGTATLTQLPNGLQLTEWHPILDTRRRWRFPLMVGRRVLRRCPAVYNLVLDREHVALVDGVPCVTLGHGINGPVVGHPFWGTSAVLEQLASHPGWAEGRVVLAEPLRSQDLDETNRSSTFRRPQLA